MADVDFSLADKRHIAALLDGLGIDYIEGGYPGANPLDTEFFAQKPKLQSARGLQHDQKSGPLRRE